MMLMFLQQDFSFQQALLAWAWDNLALIGGAFIIWYRFGRNAEKVFANLGKVGEIGTVVKEMTGALYGIRELLTRHDVRLDNIDKEIERVETQTHARISRIEGQK